MTTEQFKNFFEQNNLNVHMYEQDGKQCAEVQTWTDGGVEMTLNISPLTMEEFGKEVEDFDIDDEIILHRELANYRANFTLRESVNDFEKYHNRLKQLLSELKTPKFNKFKMRAEGACDILQFIQQAYPHLQEYAMTMLAKGIPDVVFEFTSDLSLYEIGGILDSMPDSHVMLETVQPFELYTAKRGF